MADLVSNVEELLAENLRLKKKVEELEEQVVALQGENQELTQLVDSLRGSQEEPTHRNILYSELKDRKRLPVFNEPNFTTPTGGSLVFGECFAVRDHKEFGQDLWLQISGGDHANKWVLGRHAGGVNCVDMTNDRGNGRVESNEYTGQDFPKKLYSEGFPGTSSKNICLISASGDSFWREVNIEMLFRGIATATVFEEAWGGDDTFTDWVAYYAVNCVQYGQLRTPMQKRLLVTVKPTSCWPEFQSGRCLGPDLTLVRDEIGKAQYKECHWLQGMKDQLHVKWEDVEFLTAFSFLRAHCAWTMDDCRGAANARILWVLQEFFTGGFHKKAEYELECAKWLWDEAFHGCTFEETARTRAFADLQTLAQGPWPLGIPSSLHTTGAAPLAWHELAAAAAAAARAAAESRMDGGGRFACGAFHSTSVDATGKLQAWGNNDEGQCDASALAPGENWAAVSAGFDFTLGLAATGALHAWGQNDEGQCSPPSLAHGESWTAVSAGMSHALGLTDTGTLRAWGDNSNGQCDIPTLPAGVHWAAASAGKTHSLGVTSAGTLYAWGLDASGECRRVPKLPQDERWRAVSAGDNFSLGLTASGELHAWGDDRSGQHRVPVLAPSEHWVAMSAGGYHSVGLTSAGELRAWGRNLERQCNVPSGKRWVAASTGRFHTLGLTAAGAVHAWGRDREGQVSRTP